MRAETKSDVVIAKRGGEIADGALGAVGEVGRFAGFFLFRILGSEVAGEGLKDSADHQFLALRFAFTGFHVFFQLGRQMLAVEQMKNAVHGAERLGQVVDDTVQQDFFLLNFTEQLFVDQQGIASGLKNLLLLVESLGKVAHDQHTTAVQKISGSFEGDFAATRFAFGPVAGIGRAGGGFGIPKLLRIENKIFKEWRSITDADFAGIGGEIAPERLAPGRPCSDELKLTVAEIFEQGEALVREKRFEEVGRGRHLLALRRLRQPQVRAFHAVAGLGAGVDRVPTGRGEFGHLRRINFPLIGKIEFIQEQQRGELSEFLDHAFIQRQRIVERLAAGAVGDQQIAGHAAEVSHAHFLVNVFAVNIPQNQSHLAAIGLDDFLVDFYADGGVVMLVKNGGDETADQTGLAYRERAQHADFFLDHGARLSFREE